MNGIVDLRFGLVAMFIVVCQLVRPLSLRAAEPDPPTPSPVSNTVATTSDPPVTSATNATNAAMAAAADLRAAQEAIEQLRREIETSATRNAEAITAGLGLIEPTLARMHERQMEAVQSSNRTILLVAGVFAAVGFVGLIFISLILVRAIGRFSELAVAPRALLGSGSGLPALGEGEMLPARPGAMERATGRFQGAIDQLQQRIHELERSLLAATENVVVAAPTAPGQVLPASSARPGLPETTAVSNIQPLPARPAAASATAPAGEPVPANARVSVLVGKGQALLNLDSAEQALECFEEALQLEPTNADAMVKKGMALEKLQDWERALEQYNRAIAADPGITVAYLYRGGVYNRLQRYREALESYEEALRTEKKSKAS